MDTRDLPWNPSGNYLASLVYSFLSWKLGPVCFTELWWGLNVFNGLAHKNLNKIRLLLLFCFYSEVCVCDLKCYLRIFTYALFKIRKNSCVAKCPHLGQGKVGSQWLWCPAQL